MTRSQLHAQINNSDFYNGFSGLEITATYFGQEANYDLDRDETINYLSAAGVIDIKDGVVSTDEGFVSYEDWRTEYELTEEDIKDVLILIKSAEEAKRTTERIMNQTKAA